MEPASDCAAPAITDAEFAQFQALLRGITGIHLSEFKKTLLVTRLASRLRERKVRSFTEYYKIIRHPLETDELQLAINHLTTNETFFFREPDHFQILKDFIASLRPIPMPFRVWSAASSSGEEAYSIAMVLADVLGGAKWEVVGSDISTRVLDRARTGLYPMERNGGIPKEYLQRFCLKGQGPQDGMMLIGKQLRDRVRFAQVNLNEPLPDLGRFDLIFLRNILIYFQNDQKRKVVEAVLPKLNPNGLLIVGHSENLMGVSERVKQVRPTVYRAA
ncbi:MAG: CheR family methyltransferase [Holophaga sp.]|nr:CheR family methyltransferase [Holophaga sp.]